MSVRRIIKPKGAKDRYELSALLILQIQVTSMELFERRTSKVPDVEQCLSTRLLIMMEVDLHHHLQMQMPSVPDQPQGNINKLAVHQVRKQKASFHFIHWRNSLVSVQKNLIFVLYFFLNFAC